ncbi:MAG: carboxypeptidase-like regulatory domain-containing protein [Gemmataceae bacterium]
MLAAARWAALAAVVLTVGGCGPAADRRGRVHGAVTLDGQPLPSGRVRLFALTGGVGSDGEVANGRYYIPAGRGLTAGTYRVEISAERPTGRKVPDRDAEPGATKDETVESIPARYNRDSTLRIEFDPSADRPFDFDLKSKP